MKNIHVLATDKPSRLYRVLEGYLKFETKETNYRYTQNQNIYITSDEEIKLNDYVIQVNFEKTNTQVIRCETESQVKIANDKNGSFTKNKIIITTDIELIKDGVQSIDDEFLNWFVKNPSCEEVDIKKIYLSNKGEWKDVLLPSEWEVDTKINYKIIIPKEEPKQELPQLGTKEFNNLASAYFGGKPKQETLEEVAEKYAELSYYGDEVEAFVRGAKWGAKWQAERMYSEEDMQEYAEFCIRCNQNRLPCITAKDWFEQFKKK